MSDAQNPSKKWIIGYVNTYKIKWDLFIILLALYNSISIPIELSLQPPFMNNNHGLIAVNLIIDFLFFLDMLASFRTTFVNQWNGDEISNPREIAIEYLKGDFTMDLLSTIPFELIYTALIGNSRH